MSNENLQYALLALVNGLEAYTKRRNQIDDFEAKRRYDQPGRDLDMQYKRARIESTKALTEKRRKDEDQKDPLDEVVKGMPEQYGYPVLADVQRYFKTGKDYDEVMKMAQDELSGVDKKYPLPEPTKSSLGDDVLPDARLVQSVEKNRRDARTKHAMTIGAIENLRHKKYNPWSSAPGAPESRPAMQGAMAPGAPDPSKIFGHNWDQPQQPPGGGGPQMAAGGTLMLDPGQQRLTGQVGPQTGGAKITPPRVPTAEIAEQNFKAFASAPQGPLANIDDQRKAGTVAQLWTVVMDENMPFEQHAAAWFKLHEMMGVPVPDVFQQYATGMGIPRSVIDAASGQGAIGSNWHQGRGQHAPGNPPPEVIERLIQAANKERPGRRK